MAQLDDTIRENASGPAKASDDAGSVEQHKLTDQIAAAKHLGGNAAMDEPHQGLRFTKLRMPGA